ncbi:hypothetical protein HPB49_000748 [Dermacentor silvarum]|uniref:Uncharacterized protein n=1 Tax=Dermacentor silvarum TaxID=543639 RepID=A0ACB8CIW4_DERSI|nr:hypothetical protein HPB49_000748 [Dermacentor silvarum]
MLPARGLVSPHELSCPTGALPPANSPPAHTGTRQHHECNTDTEYVIAGCTSLQTADIYWNKPLKASLQRPWIAFMRNRKKTPKGNLMMPSRQDMLDFMAAAWALVPEETTAYLFKDYGIKNMLNGTANYTIGLPTSVLWSRKTAMS